MLSGDTPLLKINAEKHDFAKKAAVHHSLISDAYDYIAVHQTEAKIAAGAVVVAGAAIALRHFMPPAVTEKVLATGGSLLEQAIGKTPNKVQEFKVLNSSEEALSLVSRLRTDKSASGLLRVQDAHGAQFNLLTGHSPLASEAAAKADRIATCFLPDGCADKGLFGPQKGRLFFNFDGAKQSLKFTQGDTLASRVSRFFQKDERAWVPLGPHPSNDLKALAFDRAAMAKLETLSAGEAKPKLDIKAITDKWESQQSTVNRNADRQDFLSNLIRSEILPEMKGGGQISKDWKFFATQIHSAADHGEADGLFVNTLTGDAHLVDFSTSPFKRIRPFGESLDVRRAGIMHRTEATSAELAEARNDGMRDKKIAGVRTQGLLGYDKYWFDEMGKLDVEQYDAAEFRTQLATHLSDLTEAPAYFNVGKTPFADIVVDAPDQQLKQLEALKEWTLDEARKPDSLHPEGYKEYANALEDSINFLRKNFTAAGDAKHFGSIVQESAEQSIFRWAMERVGPSVTNESGTAAHAITTPLNAAAKGDSDLYFVKEKGILSFTHEGLTYNSDVLTGDGGVLDRSRRALVQQGRVKEMFENLREKQKTQILARLGSKDKPATEEKAISEITSILINRGNEIKSGGQAGMPRRGELPVLIQRIQNRIQIRDVDTMTRPTNIPGTAGTFNPKKLPSMQ